MCVTTGARLSGTTTRSRPLASLNTLTCRRELASADAKHDVINMRASRRMWRGLPVVHMGRRILGARAAPRRMEADARTAAEAAVVERAGMPPLLVFRGAKSNDNAVTSLRPSLPDHSARCLTFRDTS